MLQISVTRRQSCMQAKDHKIGLMWTHLPHLPCCTSMFVQQAFMQWEYDSKQRRTKSDSCVHYCCWLSKSIHLPLCKCKKIFVLVCKYQLITHKQATLFNDIACWHVWQVTCHTMWHFTTIQRVKAHKLVLGHSIQIIATSRALYVYECLACLLAFKLTCRYVFQIAG